MRPHLSQARLVVVVAALLVLSPTAGVSQSEPSNDAVLGDCPSGTIRVTNLGSDYKVTLDKQSSVANGSGVLCRYRNGGGVSPFIEIHWSDKRGGPGEAGACDRATGGVEKDGSFWKSRERMLEAGWSPGIGFKGGPAAEKKLLRGLVRKLEGKGVGGPCDAGEMPPEDATPPDSGDTDAASVSLYPSQDYCNCPTALKAFRKIQRDYDADEVKAVRDAARALERIKTSQQYKVEITSKWDESMKARVIWTGSPWRRYEAFEKKIGNWEILAGSGISPVAAFSSLRSSLRSIINTFRELQQDKPMAHHLAVEKLTTLHVETKQAVRLAEEVQDRLYCANGLGIDIAMVRVANATKRVCIDERKKSDPKQWKKLALKGLVGLEIIRADNVAGNADILDRDRSLVDLDPDGEDAVAEALAKCEKLGVEVIPYPVDPLPMAQCEAAAPAGE